MQRSTAYAEALAPVAGCMLEEARIEPGQRVLDVGSGSGDMALLAAQATGPSGFVLATDVSRAGMAGLAARIDTHGAPCAIEAIECAAEDLAVEPGTFDVALARNCVMYFRDPGRAFAGIHGALRRGGRFVASVYGALEHEPFHAIPIAAVERRAPLPEPPPEYVQAFRVAAADVQAVLITAGFTDLRARIIRVQRTYADLASMLDQLRASTSLAELLSTLPEDHRDAAWADIEDGFRRYAGAAGLCIPGEQVIVVGTA
jgi:SAM-dependent methyltransferase